MSQTETSLPPREKRDRQDDTPTVTEFGGDFADDASTFGDRITELAKLSLVNPDEPVMLGIQMDVSQVSFVEKVLKSPVDDNMELLREKYRLREARLDNAIALIEHLQGCMANLDVFLGAEDEEEWTMTARDIISLLLILELVLPRLMDLANQIYKLPRF